jgi:fucose permease
MSGNFINISVNTQAVGVEVLYKRSVMASFHGLWSLAGFAGAAVGTFMVSQGIQPLSHFLVIASVLVILSLLMFRHSLRDDISKQIGQKRFTLPDKPLLKLGVIAFCSMSCEGCMFDWSGIYFRDIVRVPPELVTLGYTSFMAMMATGRFIGDSLVTKLGVKRVLRISGSCIAGGLVLAVAFPNIYVATVAFLLTGFGVSSVIPLTYGVAGKSSTMSAGMAIAAVSTVGYLGFLFGPPVIGYIAKAASLRWSFALMGLFGSMIFFLAGQVKAADTATPAKYR